MQLIDLAQVKCLVKDLIMRAHRDLAAEHLSQTANGAKLGGREGSSSPLL